MTSPLAWIDDELDELRAGNIFRRRRVVRSLPDAWCEVETETGWRRLRNFAANDYLNLKHDPRVTAAAQAALADGGTGSGASALVTGRTPWHAALEERLAAFEGQEQAILFPSGYAANLGVLAALAGPEDAVYCDRLNHASLVDGCRLSGARLRVYRHGELEELEQQLRTATDFRRRMIVTDSLFSMDGDCASLAGLCDLAARYGAILVVDEAHGTGVFGEHGRGVAELQGVEHRVAVRVGTLSKAVGAQGGFVAGPAALIDWLWNKSRTQMYSTALPPHVCAAATAAIDLIEAEPERRTRLAELSAEFRGLLRELSLETPSSCAGPIIPVILHDPGRAIILAERLESRGYLVAAIRPPTVPRGTSRLRITLSCAHTPDDLRGLATALAELTGGLCRDPPPYPPPPAPPPQGA